MADQFDPDDFMDITPQAVRFYDITPMTQEARARQVKPPAIPSPVLPPEDPSGITMAELDETIDRFMSIDPATLSPERRAQYDELKRRLEE